MLMHSGDRWHCTNPACRCELSVEQNTEIRSERVHCACGGVMKQHYTAPVFRYLDFILEPETQNSPSQTPEVHFHDSRKA